MGLSGSASSFSFAVWANDGDDGGARVVRDFQLHRDGFQVYPKFHRVSAKMVGNLDRYSTMHAEELFNSAGAGEDANDGLRRQVPVESFMAEDTDVAALHDELVAKVRDMFPGKTPRDMVVLRSDPGCSVQRAHTDYTAGALRKVLGDDDKVPLACVIALMDETRFDVWPGAIRCFDLPDDAPVFPHLQLTLNAGDMLVFRGDLVHGGAAFAVANIRLHMYLDVQGVRRVNNKTFYMDESPYVTHRSGL